MEITIFLFQKIRSSGLGKQIDGIDSGSGRMRESTEPRIFFKMPFVKNSIICKFMEIASKPVILTQILPE